MDTSGAVSGTSVAYPHAVKFYKDDTALGRTVAEFLAPGLRERWPAIVIATPDHRTLIVSELQRLDVDVPQLEADGDLQILDADRLLSRFMVGPEPDPVAFHDTVSALIDRACKGRRPCPVRAYGEMVDVLWKRANPTGAIKLEMLWNQVATHADFSLLCGYAVGNFYKELASGPTRQTVCDHHNHMMPDERAS